LNNTFQPSTGSSSYTNEINNHWTLSWRGIVVFVTTMPTCSVHGGVNLIDLLIRVASRNNVRQMVMVIEESNFSKSSSKIPQNLG
jgi:hypothetical protein